MRRLDEDVARPHDRPYIRSWPNEARGRLEAMLHGKRAGRRPDIPRMIVHVGSDDDENSAGGLQELPGLHQIHEALFATQPADEHAHHSVGTDSKLTSKFQPFSG